VNARNGSIDWLSRTAVPTPEGQLRAVIAKKGDAATANSFKLGTVDKGSDPTFAAVRTTGWNADFPAVRHRRSFLRRLRGPLNGGAEN
jgi:hypothetical protein